MKTLRLIVPLALAGALTACSGSGGLGSLSPIFGGSGAAVQCDPGTAVQLANPQPYQTVSNVSQITIVANGDSNTLYNTSANWYVYLIDSYGNQITGGNLNPASYPNGPHPYGSDFYYSSQLPETLPAGVSYTAYLGRHDQACNAVPLQGFSTQ